MIFNNFSRNLLTRGKYFALYIRTFQQGSTYIPSLTSCTQLANILDAPKWYETHRVLDATWDLDDRDYRANHLQHRIGGSKFFSFDECRDQTDKIPRQLPSLDDFAEYVTALGISNDHHVVVYDNNETHGIYSSPRVWWMFRVFGHDNVSVLDGGFQKWLSEGHVFVSGDYGKDEILTAPDKPFKASKRLWLVKDFEFMKANALSDQRVKVADARGRQRFLGLTDDGGVDPSQGHIPGASSVPFPGVLNDNRTVKSREEIHQYFASSGVELNEDLIASCGSGVTACILALAAHHADKKDVPVYDGSWSEWPVRAGEDMIARGDD